MPKLLFTVGIFLCINMSSLKAQDSSPFVSLWDSIPPEDLTMTTYAPDTSAAAVVLLDNGYLSASLHLQKCVLKCLHRVKILKKSAFDDYGKHSFTIRSYEKLVDVRAQTINPDGTRTPVIEFFDEKINEFVKRKKFAFPKLQEGSIIEYEYTMESSNLMELYPWYFQEVIPVRHSQLIVDIPPTLEYIYLKTGEREINQGLMRLERKANFARLNLVSQDSIFYFHLDTVEAMKPEGFVTTMSDYISSVKFQLSKFYPLSNYGIPRLILKDWYFLAQDFLEDKALGQQLAQKSKYKDIWKAVKPILEKATTREEKIRLCYEYISKNVTWIDDYFSIYIQETLEDAFKKKKANSGELNLMLIACLNEADIKAVPLLVSTRDNGKPNMEYPLPRQFNHLLCYIEGEKPMILDAGNIHRPINYPRIPSLNGTGFVLDTKHPRWITIVAPLSSQTVLANCSLSAEGVLSGRIDESHSGYSAVNERTHLKEDDKNDNIKKAWAHTFPDIQLDSIKIMNKDSLHLPFKRSMSFSLPNAAIVAGDLLYIKPTLKTDFDESLFKQTTRNYPIDMPNPIRDNFVLNMTLPEGFTVEELPKEAKITLIDNSGSYIYSCTHKDNQIQLRVRVEIKQLHFPKEAYTGVKEFFDMIAAKQAEQIVLKKKEENSNNKK